MPDWIKDPNDQMENFELDHVASSTRNLLFLHGVEGNLWFESDTPQIQEHPVPLGTTIRCTGAKGYPPPKYVWSMADPSQSSSPDVFSYMDLAYSPGVFRDSPEALPASTFQENLLQLPSDPRYRGMSFLFRCQAFNEVSRRVYRVERLIFLSICLCDTRFVSLDLSLIYSPQMVAGHALLDNRDLDNSLDFYGQRYVHVLRQIILGLSQGPKYVRISTNPTCILNSTLKTAPLYASPMPLTHSLSRFQLANGLISASVRPKPVYQSGVDACPRKVPVNLTAVLRSVEQNISIQNPYFLNLRRLHAIVLPLDRWDQGDVVEFMQRMRKNYVSVIGVYFENPTGWAQGSPEYKVQLSSSKTFSEGCSTQTETDPATFIERLPLFDAICKVARAADVQERWIEGITFLSHIQKYIFVGENITLYSVVRLNPFDTEEYQLSACLMEHSATTGLNRHQDTQQKLEALCEEQLGFSSASKPGEVCLTIAQPLTLKASHDGVTAIVYQKGVNKTLAVSRYVRYNIKLQKPDFKKPYLSVKYLAEKAQDSAEFECIIEVTNLAFQIDLIYRSRRNGSFVVVARTTAIKAGFVYGDVNRKVSARLVWPAVPAEAEDADIYCLLSNPPIVEKVLDSLPPHSSDPVRLTFITSCPMRPTIKRIVSSPFTGDSETPRLGARMSFVCEAVTGGETNHPLQMALADRTEQFVICSRTGMGNVNTTVPCTFATWNEGGCGKFALDAKTTHPKALFAQCSISQVPNKKITLRRIEYTMPMVTIDQFDAFLFCETLPPWQVDEDLRLLSDPLDNLFAVDPTVTSINIGYYKWVCDVIAYPPPTSYDWRIKDAQPWNFDLGLRKIPVEKSNFNSTRTNIEAVSARGFFPKKFIPPNTTSPYFFTLSRDVPSFWQVGAWGTATLECTATNKEGKTTVREGFVNYATGNSTGRWLPQGALHPTIGRGNLGEPWIAECPIIGMAGASRVINLYILGKVEFLQEQYVNVPLFHTTHSACYVCRFYLFDGYNEVEVQPEFLVFHPSDPPIFAYKLVSGVWAFAGQHVQPPTLFKGDRVETRCLVWHNHDTVISNLESPFLARSDPMHSQISKIPSDKLRSRKFVLVNNLQYHLLEHAFIADASHDLMKYLGCYLNIQPTNKSNVVEKFGPLRVCSPPSSLKIYPALRSELKADDFLNCSDDHAVFSKSTLSWKYKLGPLPRPRGSNATDNFKQTVMSSTLVMSTLPSPGFYVFTCRAISVCNEKELVSEVDVQFLVLPKDGATWFTAVNLSPRIVLIPQSVSVECPSVLTPGSGLTAKNLTWFRFSRQAELTSPGNDPSASVLSYHDLINGTIITNHPNFLSYKEKKGEETFFSMDIKPTSYNDFGYYGCTLGAFHLGIGINEFNFDQVSPYPVCLVVNTTSPKIKLVSPSSDKCYRVGDVLEVTCEVMAYQGFCVEDDKPLGTRLLSSMATLSITFENNEIVRVLNVSSSIIVGENPPRIMLTFTPVLLTISPEHDGARLTCTAKPNLNTQKYNFSTDWDNLQPKLFRYATAKLCALYPPSNVIINPPQLNQVDVREVAVLNSGQWITCHANGNPSPIITIDAFPIVADNLTNVITQEVSDLNDWRDTMRPQPNWATEPLLNDTGVMMLVTKEHGAPEGLAYLGLCKAVNEINGNKAIVHKAFVFHLRDSSIDIVEDASLYQFAAVTFLVAIITFILVTFVREFLILHRRRIRTKAIQ
uniref:Ig-like domain-containing protein n=1 Tax=Mesocestoides corti TaxID=53468 RepID=A0A5K3EHJ3_MESCO